MNRNKGEKGFCAQSSDVKIGRSALHYWEEPSISGERGSGTVFFSGCSLRCIYCQNFNLSRGKLGQSPDKELSDVFMNLQEMGAHNINLVTAEHFAPHIKEAVIRAREKGLKIPVILNSSGYVSLETLELLKNVIDIYLVDFKYMDNVLAKNYSFAPDYPEITKKTISRMIELAGISEFDEEGMMKKGVVVRHLCLPSHTEDSKRIIKYLFETYGTKIVYSIMRQYTPVGECGKHENLCRKITDEEYDEIIDFCLELGIEDAYIQEGECAQESFIPEFR